MYDTLKAESREKKVEEASKTLQERSKRLRKIEEIARSAAEINAVRHKHPSLYRSHAKTSSFIHHLQLPPQLCYHPSHFAVSPFFAPTLVLRRVNLPRSLSDGYTTPLFRLLHVSFLSLFFALPPTDFSHLKQRAIQKYPWRPTGGWRPFNDQKFPPPPKMKPTYVCMDISKRLAPDERPVWVFETRKKKRREATEEERERMILSQLKRPYYPTTL